MSEQKFSNLLSSLFAVKEITFEQFEIYLWTEEKGERAKTLEIFERGNDYFVIFCLSNVHLSINGTPYNFVQFDFSCRCDSGKCCDLYISPDVFNFNAEKDINVETLQKMEVEATQRLSGIAQALFSLSDL